MRYILIIGLIIMVLMAIYFVLNQNYARACFDLLIAYGLKARLESDYE